MSARLDDEAIERAWRNAAAAYVRAQRDRLGARIDACDSRRSKSPSHVEELRSAVVAELLSWKAAGVPIDAESLLIAVERYDRAKGGAR